MQTDRNLESRDLVNVARLSKALRDAVPSIADAANRASEAFGNLPRSTTLPALAALHNTGKHIYAGTANPRTVEGNRRRNKVARAQRRINGARNFRKGVR